MLPEKIRVIDTEYQMIYFDKLSEVSSSGRDMCLGEVDFVDGTIRVYTGPRPTSAVGQTILHEVVHAIMGQLQIKGADGEPLYANEEVVDLLATGINHVFQTNKELRDFIALGGQSE